MAEKLEGPRTAMYNGTSISKDIYSESVSISRSVQIRSLTSSQPDFDDVLFLKASSEYFKCGCDKTQTNLSEAFGKIREAVEVNVGTEKEPKAVKGLTLFGTLDIENIDPIARSICLGVYKSIINGDPDKTVKLVDSGGAGWGLTTSIMLRSVEAAIDYLKDNNKPIPNIEIHSVDKRFDLGSKYQQIAKDHPSVFEFKDYYLHHPSPLEISDASKRYLPQHVEIGVFTHKELEDQRLIQKFKDNGVKVCFHRTDAEKFYRWNENSLKDGTLGVVVIDGEHSISTRNDGVKQLQCLEEISSAVNLGAKVIVTDDRKPTPPSCPVQVSIELCAKAIGEINTEKRTSVDLEESNKARKAFEETYSLKVEQSSCLKVSAEVERNLKNYSIVYSEGSKTATFISSK
jgi:hypothetical protein